MRYFNTHGPVNAKEHYVVARRPLIEKMVGQIGQGKFFTVFAPRQMGKTTLLHNLDDALQQKTNFLPIPLSFEAYESWADEEFWSDFSSIICEDIQAAVEKLNPSNATAIVDLLTTAPPINLQAFWNFFRQLHAFMPELKIVLVIDEFDSTPKTILTPLLQTWRRMYLERSRRPHSLHSLVLIGIQNIAKLNLGRSSPFNVAYEQRLDEFSQEEVNELMAQYSAETGQGFAPHVIQTIFEQTGGQPFLVNRVAAILTEEIVQDCTRLINLEDLRLTIRQIVTESNYNFETLQRRASEHKEEVVKILFGAKYPFNRNDPLIKDLFMYGIVAETADGFSKIANPIYQHFLITAFRPRGMGEQGDLLVNGHDFRPYIVNGRLQMERILSQFRQFMERRGRAAFEVTPMPQEATGQYLLMGYLDAVMRQVEGDVFSEVPTGEGRLDLLASHLGQRYVIETKIWRGQVEFERGVAQLCDYLESEGQQIGYFVVFHARPNVYGKLGYDELEFMLPHGNKQIYVYLIRLGEIIGENAEKMIAEQVQQ